MTSQPTRLSTNFITLIPSLTFTELQVVSMEHLQRVWHTYRERLHFRRPAHPLGTDFLMIQLLKPVFRTCRVFSRLFTLNTPRFFSRFCFYAKQGTCVHTLNRCSLISHDGERYTSNCYGLRSSDIKGVFQYKNANRIVIMVSSSKPNSSPISNCISAYMSSRLRR